MLESGNEGYCATSQAIRARIEKDLIILPKSASLESRIQPSSFEPGIGDHLYVLDSDSGGLFRPNKNETVKRMLLRVPRRRRSLVGIEKGFELKRGFHYLAPLEEKIILQEDEFVISSPKSSRGRLFLGNRLLSDYNASFDEVTQNVGEEIGLWLLLQPTKFNVIVYPGMTFNQLRFFKGDAELSDDEIRRECLENPVLVYQDKDSFTNAENEVRNGLKVHLDLLGKATAGVVGLRARNNPEPIDLSKRDFYSAEDFFEPLVSRQGEITIKPGEAALLSSKETLRIPFYLNAELDRHSHLGIRGILHEAGFIDNGFLGDLVFEVISGESGEMVLRDGMPLSTISLFRTNGAPDKIYGEKIGSSYQRQTGPKPSNNFRKFDFAYAAKNYKKLDREVLVQEPNLLLRHRENKEGFQFLDADRVATLIEDVTAGFFHSRYDCEEDASVLQPIPYVLIFGPKGTVFSYVRAENIEDYGDTRLMGKHSIGVGGHISITDAPDYLANCLDREVMKEEVRIEGRHTAAKLVGTLMSYKNPVDRVHFGLIYAMRTDGSVHPKDKALISGRMLGISELCEFAKDGKYETWSNILIPHIEELAARSSSYISV